MSGCDEHPQIGLHKLNHFNLVLCKVTVCYAKYMKSYIPIKMIEVTIKRKTLQAMMVDEELVILLACCFNVHCGMVVVRLSFK